MRSVDMKQPILQVRVKKLIEVDGLKFKDLNGNGKLDPYEDWRLPLKERVDNLISQMTIDEKVGMMMITSQSMGKSQKDSSKTSHNGLLDEAEIEVGTNIFVSEKKYGSTYNIERLNLRHFILRDNWSEVDIAEWVNAMNEVSEGTRLGIPSLIASNSRNENAERTFGMNDAIGVFSTWPSTLGLAAVALGDEAAGGDTSIFTEFAQIARKEWTSSGLRKGYMYMIDTMTDPRWQRIYGTFGESTELITDAAIQLIKGFQGEELNSDSVALTMKHFPGGGARENGFDPHYKEGKFNVYQTPGSLEKYHLPPFQAAAEHGVSSIMPYYSIPSFEKSAPQFFQGEELTFEDVGFAFNQYFIQDILRDKLGFEGYINSDSGILDNMSWGVENLDKEDRAAKAVNAGTDMISDTNQVEWIKKAYESGKISEERIDKATKRLLLEIFKLGLFDEKTYVDPAAAKEVVSDQRNWVKAFKAHQKSVVLLKNQDILPLKEGTKVYTEFFHKEADASVNYTKEAREKVQNQGDIELVDSVEEADVALVFLYPKSGNYFSATPGLLELALCENKINKTVDGDEYSETTISNLNRVFEIADIIHAKGGQFILSVNSNMPWLLDNVEPISDALIANFETLLDAQLDVITGKVPPVGKLPFTFPKNEEVIAVDDNGESVSRNDVPGYDKDLYMPEGMEYAYKDADGNIYTLGHGLTY